MKKIFSGLLSLIIAVNITAQVVSLPLTPDGDVNAVVDDGQGGCYIGGNFTHLVPEVPGNAIISVNDASLIKKIDITGQVAARVSNDSGGWYYYGQFTQIGTTPCSGFGQVKANGSVDNWFPTDVTPGNGYLTAFARDKDANLYFGYYRESDITFHLFKYDKNRNLVASTYFNHYLNTVQPDSSGNLYVSGTFTKIGGIAQGYVARLKASDLTIDGGWPISANNWIYKFMFDGNGYVYLCGSFTQIDATPRNCIARIKISDASLDATWNPNANNYVNDMCFSNNKTYLFAVGTFTTIGGVSRRRIARIVTATGSVDTWGSAYLKVNGSIQQVVADANDNLLVQGNFTSLTGYSTANFHFGRIDWSGHADTATWLPCNNDWISYISKSGNELFVSGSYTKIGAFIRVHIARINADGSLNAWDPGSTYYPYSNVNCMLRSKKDGSLYVGHFSVDRFKPNGQFDSTFNVNTEVWGLVKTMTFDKDSNILVGGGILHVGFPNKYIQRIKKADFLIDPSFYIYTNGMVNAIAVDKNGSIYVGGEGTNIGSTNGYYTKFNSDVTESATQLSVNGSVRAIAIDSVTNNVFIGGTFSTVQGKTRNKIAKIKFDGSVDDLWNPNANDTVNCIVLDSAGKNVFVGGKFTSIGGQTRNYIANIRSNYSSAMAWDPNADNKVNAMAINNKGYMFIGGSYQNIATKPYSFFSKFIIPPVARLYPNSYDICQGNVKFYTTPSGVGPFTYTWMKGTQVLSDGGDISGAATNTLQISFTKSDTGKYRCVVSNSYGTDTTTASSITYFKVYTPSICMVRYDSSENRNMIIWEKPAGIKNVKAYKIYRDGGTGNFSLIDSVPYSRMSAALDTFNDPNTNSILYRITAVDSCGNESAKSPYHRTMHIVPVVRTDGKSEIMFLDSYKDEAGIFLPDTFYIYKGKTKSTLKLFAKVPSNVSSYTDNSWDSTTTFYQAGIIKKNPCSPSGLLKAESGPYTQSLSNITEYKGMTINVTGLTVAPSTASVAIGSNITLNATFSPANATDKTVSWSSSNPAIATVNSAGKVTGVSVGACNITATSTDGGKTSNCLVTVTLSNDLDEFNMPLNLSVYPNPFSETFRITYSLYVEDDVTIDIFNSQGVKVYSKMIKGQAAGQHDLTIDPATCGLIPGPHFINVRTKEKTSTIKCSFLK